jgi:ribonuclease D
MHELLGELEQRGRTRIVEGECRRLAELQPPVREFHPDEFVRVKGARKLSLLEMRVLREVFVLRDRIARERDVPPFKVLPPAALIPIAKARPGSMRALERVSGVPASIVRRLGHELLRAVARALEQGPLERVPAPPSRSEDGELDEIEAELHERLKLWRKSRAQREGIDSSLVLNRRILERLARERPTTRAGLVKAGLLDWQLELFGQELAEGIANFEKDLAEGRVEPRRRWRR